MWLTTTTSGWYPWQAAGWLSHLRYGRYPRADDHLLLDGKGVILGKTFRPSYIYISQPTQTFQQLSVHKHLCTVYIYIWVFPEMAYTKFMITCMLHFRESYPESCPRIIPRIIPMILKACFWNIRLNWYISRDDLVQLLSNPASTSVVRQCHQNDLYSTQDVHLFESIWHSSIFSFFQETVARPNHA